MAKAKATPAEKPVKAEPKKAAATKAASEKPAAAKKPVAAKPAAPAKKSTAKKTVTTAQIAARAYEIFLSRGGQPGNEVSDWLQAEQELKSSK